jgi:ribose 5-phosphate isomerase B
MIYLGSDHAGFKLKQEIVKYLKVLGYATQDLGNKKFDKNDDNPDYAFKVGEKVAGRGGMGILFCGSAEGVCIAANKVEGIRAVNPASSKLAKLSREHNNANVLCLSGWYTKPAQAKKMIAAWLGAKFSGKPRHARRIGKITKYESCCCGEGGLKLKIKS